MTEWKWKQVFKEDIKSSLEHYMGVKECNVYGKHGRKHKILLGGEKKGKHFHSKDELRFCDKKVDNTLCK